MASALQALILSAFIVCLVKGQLSKYDTDILVKLTRSVDEKVGPECNRQYRKTIQPYNSDRKVEFLCNDLKANGTARTSLTSWGCKREDVDSIEKKACDLFTKSNQDQAYLMIKLFKMLAKFSESCQNKITSTGTAPETWYDVEKLCLKVKKTDQADFKKQCPGDEYYDVKDVVCGGASNLVCGLLTIGMGFVAAIFKNL